MDPDNLFLVDPPLRGTPYRVPPISSLPPIEQGIGKGCFMLPNSSVGVPLLPTGSIRLNQCDPGYFCPYITPDTNTTLMVICPPNADCFLRRLGAKACLPQGRYEPTPCLPGFYCPDVSTILPCPQGHYCLTGSTVPTPCQYMSDCPVGTIVETHYGLLLILLLFDVVITIALYCWRLFELRRAGQSAYSIMIPGPVRRALVRRKHRLIADKPAMQSEHIKPIPSLRYPSIVIDESHDGASSSIAALIGAFKKGFNNCDTLRMNLKFNDLSLALGKSYILNGVSGDISAGRMTAIMGPSGAGKTTFMNVLMGKISDTGGSLMINGQKASMGEFRKIIGFVPQEDIMHRDLTVRENVLYSARNRLPSSWTDVEIQRHVDSVLSAMSLNLVAHTSIGDEVTRGISGGQRKRVNIAMELAAIPLAIFLDEPTSGLDSTAALDVANVLRSISRLGLTIVSVIHQPRVEIFEKFDDVLLLVPGGRTAYFGPINRVQEYFESLGFNFVRGANHADILMDILSGRGKMVDPNGPDLSITDMVTKWESSEFLIALQSAVVPAALESQTLDTMQKIVRSRGASFLAQIRYSHDRSLLKQSRALSTLRLEIFVGSFAGFLMGFSAVDNSEPFRGLLYPPYELLSSQQTEWIVALYTMLIGMSVALAAAPSGVLVFTLDKAVYWREIASGHRSSSFFIGTCASVLYRIALSSAHFTAIYYVLARPVYTVGLQFLLIFLNFVCVYGLSAIVSMISDQGNASLLAVIASLFMSVNCGFGISFNRARDGHFMWVFDLGPNRWAAEAQVGLTLNKYKHIYNIAGAVETSGFDLNGLHHSIIMMLVLAVVYRVIAYFLMIWLNKDQQK